jgi:hypothetical protein
MRVAVVVFVLSALVFCLAVFYWYADESSEDKREERQDDQLDRLECVQGYTVTWLSAYKAFTVPAEDTPVASEAARAALDSATDDLDNIEGLCRNG